MRQHPFIIGSTNYLSPEINLTKHMEQPTTSELSADASESGSHIQPSWTCTLGKYSNELIFSDSKSGLQTDSYQPFCERMIQHTQELRSISQNCISPAPMEQNAVTRRADSDLQRMRNVEVHQHSEVCVPTSVVPILPVEPTLSLPEVSINYQDSTISSHAKSCDFSTLRKSRLKCSKRNNGRNLKSREQFHGKRSQHFTEEDRCYLPPSKQFISEEKMAARMSHLSITNENTMASLQERWLQAKLKTKRQLEEIERRLSDSESDNDDDSNSDTRDGKPRQIQVSPELKMAMEKQEPLLPDSVVKSIANVCTELVLWKPPSSYISGTFNLSPNLDLVSTDKSDVPSSNNMKPSGSEASGLPSASIPKKQSDDTSHKCSFTDIVYGEISPSWTCVPDKFFDGVDDNMEF